MEQGVHCEQACALGDGRRRGRLGPSNPPQFACRIQRYKKTQLSTFYLFIVFIIPSLFLINFISRPEIMKISLTVPHCYCLTVKFAFKDNLEALNGIKSWSILAFIEFYFL